MLTPFDQTQTCQSMAEMPSNVRVAYGKCDCVAQALAQNEVMKLIAVDAGDTVLGIAVKVTAIDAGATDFDIGDGNATARYADGLSMAVLGYLVTGYATTFLPYTYAAADTIDLKMIDSSGSRLAKVEVWAIIAKCA